MTEGVTIEPDIYDEDAQKYPDRAHQFLERLDMSALDPKDSIDWYIIGDNLDESPFREFVLDQSDAFFDDYENDDKECLEDLIELYVDRVREIFVSDLESAFSRIKLR